MRTPGLSASPPTERRLGVCVLNWNAGEVLTGCVESILAGVDENTARVVIVDNASTDGSIANLKARFPTLEVIVNARNHGYAKGNNIGARHLIAKGANLLLFVNPDVSVPLGCIDHMIDTLESHPAAGCAFGLPTTKGKVSKMACRTRPTPLQKWVLYGPLSHVPALARRMGGHFVSPETLEDGAEIYAGSGAMVLFRSDAFVDIDGFDEQTFLYEEELIVGERAKAKGWSSVVSKRSEYGHLNGGSTRLIAYRRLLYFVTSEQYLLRVYYRWNWTARSALRLARYGEWLIECGRVLLVRNTPASIGEERRVNRSAS